jgi:hypothetical protein
LGADLGEGGHPVGGGLLAADLFGTALRGDHPQGGVLDGGAQLGQPAGRDLLGRRLGRHRGLVAVGG